MIAIPEQINKFKTDVMSNDNTAILDRYYYSGTGPILAHEQQATLRRAVSEEFGISVRDVLLVGSAKLGFTLTHKKERPPLSHFGDTSDIDIAIISNDLFLRYWELAFSYWNEKGDWTQANDFRKYLFRGWLRPDKLPNDLEFPDSGQWFEFFRGLQAGGQFGGYKVAAGIYFNEVFWEKYIGSALSGCRRYLEDGI